MSLNLSGSLGGQIEEMLQGSVAGDLSFITPQPEPPILDTLNVTENGTYTPPSGVDGFNEVNVDVPTPSPILETLNVTENGTYTPPSGVDGFNEVNVNTSQIILETLNVTESGTYNAPTGKAYNIVNVDIPSIKYILYGEQTATDSNWVQGVVPLNTINMLDNSYFTYDSTTKRLIALKSFTALVTSWVYNLHSSTKIPEFESRKNGSRITYFNSTTSAGAIGGNNKIINVNVNDYIDLFNIENAGWGFGRLKIYDVGNSDLITYQE